MENCSIQIGILIVAIITVIASTICSYCAIKRATKDNEKAITASLNIAKQQLISDYTRRYHEIILHCPKNIFDLTISHETDVPYLQLYFDLCSEEYLLYQQGVINEKVWVLWVDGMKTIMNRKKIQAAWKQMAQYYNNRSFIHFMDNEVIK